MYTFTYDNTNGWQETQKLMPDSPQEDGFGFSVTLQGGLLLTGADVDGITENPLTGTPLPEGSGDESGVVYVFAFDGNTWQQSTKSVLAGLEASDFYGSVVALDAPHLLVGAWGDDALADESGAFYAFDLRAIPQGFDVTGDGAVTPADVVYVLNRIGTVDTLADVDGDDVVSAADGQSVLDALGTTYP